MCLVIKTVEICRVLLLFWLQLTLELNDQVGKKDVKQQNKIFPNWELNKIH